MQKTYVFCNAFVELCWSGPPGELRSRVSKSTGLDLNRTPPRISVLASTTMVVRFVDSFDALCCDEHRGDATAWNFSDLSRKLLLLRGTHRIDALGREEVWPCCVGWGVAYRNTRRRVSDVNHVDLGVVVLVLQQDVRNAVLRIAPRLELPEVRLAAVPGTAAGERGACGSQRARTPRRDAP